ncbi:MAG: hypothetical protein ACREFH_00785 [Stellaceae bacterium]
MRAVSAILVAALLAAAPAFGQSTQTESDTDLSKDAENPVTQHLTLRLRSEAGFFSGVDRAVKDTIELDQADVPFRLNAMPYCNAHRPKTDNDTWLLQTTVTFVFPD